MPKQYPDVKGLNGNKGLQLRPLTEYFKALVDVIKENYPALDPEDTSARQRLVALDAFLTAVTNSQPARLGQSLGWLVDKIDRKIKEICGRDYLNVDYSPIRKEGDRWQHDFSEGTLEDDKEELKSRQKRRQTLREEYYKAKGLGDGQLFDKSLPTAHAFLIQCHAAEVSYNAFLQGVICSLDIRSCFHGAIAPSLILTRVRERLEADCYSSLLKSTLQVDVDKKMAAYRYYSAERLLRALTTKFNTFVVPKEIDSLIKRCQKIMSKNGELYQKYVTKQPRKRGLLTSETEDVFRNRVKAELMGESVFRELEEFSKKFITLVNGYQYLDSRGHLTSNDTLALFVRDSEKDPARAGARAEADRKAVERLRRQQGVEGAAVETLGLPADTAPTFDGSFFPIDYLAGGFYSFVAGRHFSYCFEFKPEDYSWTQTEEPLKEYYNRMRNRLEGYYSFDQSLVGCNPFEFVHLNVQTVCSYYEELRGLIDDLLKLKDKISSDHPRNMNPQDLEKIEAGRDAYVARLNTIRSQIIYDLALRLCAANCALEYRNGEFFYCDDAAYLMIQTFFDGYLGTQKVVAERSLHFGEKVDDGVLVMRQRFSMSQALFDRVRAHIATFINTPALGEQPAEKDEAARKRNTFVMSALRLPTGQQFLELESAYDSPAMYGVFSALATKCEFSFSEAEFKLLLQGRSRSQGVIEVSPIQEVSNLINSPLFRVLFEFREDGLYRDAGNLSHMLERYGYGSLVKDGKFIFARMHEQVKSLLSAAISFKWGTMGNDPRQDPLNKLRAILNAVFEKTEGRQLSQVEDGLAECKRQVFDYVRRDVEKVLAGFWARWLKELNAVVRADQVDEEVVLEQNARFHFVLENVDYFIKMRVVIAPDAPDVNIFRVVLDTIEKIAKESFRVGADSSLAEYETIPTLRNAVEHVWQWFDVSQTGAAEGCFEALRQQIHQSRAVLNCLFDYCEGVRFKEYQREDFEGSLKKLEQNVATVFYIPVGVSEQVAKERAHDLLVILTKAFIGAKLKGSLQNQVLATDSFLQGLNTLTAVNTIGMLRCLLYYDKDAGSEVVTSLNSILAVATTVAPAKRDVDGLLEIIRTQDLNLEVSREDYNAAFDEGLKSERNVYRWINVIGMYKIAASETRDRSFYSRVDQGYRQTALLEIATKTIESYNAFFTDNTNPNLQRYLPRFYYRLMGILLIDQPEKVASYAIVAFKYLLHINRSKNAELLYNLLRMQTLADKTAKYYYADELFTRLNEGRSAFSTAINQIILGNLAGLVADGVLSEGFIVMAMVYGNPETQMRVHTDILSALYQESCQSGVTESVKEEIVLRYLNILTLCFQQNTKQLVLLLNAGVEHLNVLLDQEMKKLRPIIRERDPKKVSDSSVNQCFLTFNLTNKLLFKINIDVLKEQYPDSSPPIAMERYYLKVFFFVEDVIKIISEELPRAFELAFKSTSKGEVAYLDARYSYDDMIFAFSEFSNEELQLLKSLCDDNTQFNGDGAAHAVLGSKIRNIRGMTDARKVGFNLAEVRVITDSLLSRSPLCAKLVKQSPKELLMMFLEFINRLLTTEKFINKKLLALFIHMFAEPDPKLAGRRERRLYHTVFGVVEENLRFFQEVTESSVSKNLLQYEGISSRQPFFNLLSDAITPAVGDDVHSVEKLNKFYTQINDFLLIQLTTAGVGSTEKCLAHLQGMLVTFLGDYITRICGARQQGSGDSQKQIDELVVQLDRLYFVINAILLDPRGQCLSDARTIYPAAFQPLKVSLLGHLNALEAFKKSAVFFVPKVTVLMGQRTVVQGDGGRARGASVTPSRMGGAGLRAQTVIPSTIRGSAASGDRASVDLSQAATTPVAPQGLRKEYDCVFNNGLFSALTYELACNIRDYFDSYRSQLEMIIGNIVSLILTIKQEAPLAEKGYIPALEAFVKVLKRQETPATSAQAESAEAQLLKRFQKFYQASFNVLCGLWMRKLFSEIFPQIGNDQLGSDINSLCSVAVPGGMSGLDIYDLRESFLWPAICQLAIEQSVFSEERKLTQLLTLAYGPGADAIRGKLNSLLNLGVRGGIKGVRDTISQGMQGYNFVVVLENFVMLRDVLIEHGEALSYVKDFIAVKLSELLQKLVNDIQQSNDCSPVSSDAAFASLNDLLDALGVNEPPLNEQSISFDLFKVRNRLYCVVMKALLAHCNVLFELTVDSDVLVKKLNNLYSLLVSMFPPTEERVIKFLEALNAQIKERLFCEEARFNKQQDAAQRSRQRLQVIYSILAQSKISGQGNVEYRSLVTIQEPWVRGALDFFAKRPLWEHGRVRYQIFFSNVVSFAWSSCLDQCQSSPTFKQVFEDLSLAYAQNRSLDVAFEEISSNSLQKLTEINTVLLKVFYQGMQSYQRYLTMAKFADYQAFLQSNVAIFDLLYQLPGASTLMADAQITGMSGILTTIGTWVGESKRQQYPAAIAGDRNIEAYLESFYFTYALVQRGCFSEALHQLKILEYKLSAVGKSFNELMQYVRPETNFVRCLEIIDRVSSGPLVSVDQAVLLDPYANFNLIDFLICNLCVSEVQAGLKANWLAARDMQEKYRILNGFLTLQLKKPVDSVHKLIMECEVSISHSGGATVGSSSPATAGRLQAAASQSNGSAGGPQNVSGLHLANTEDLDCTLEELDHAGFQESVVALQGQIKGISTVFYQDLSDFFDKIMLVFRSSLSLPADLGVLSKKNLLDIRGYLEAILSRLNSYINYIPSLVVRLSDRMGRSQKCVAFPFDNDIKKQLLVNSQDFGSEQHHQIFQAVLSELAQMNRDNAETAGHAQSSLDYLCYSTDKEADMLRRILLAETMRLVDSAQDIFDLHHLIGLKTAHFVSAFEFCVKILCVHPLLDASPSGPSAVSDLFCDRVLHKIEVSLRHSIVDKSFSELSMTASAERRGDGAFFQPSSSGVTLGAAIDQVMRCYKRMISRIQDRMSYVFSYFSLADMNLLQEALRQLYGQSAIISAEIDRVEVTYHQGAMQAILRLNSSSEADYRKFILSSVSSERELHFLQVVLQTSNHGELATSLMKRANNVLSKRTFGELTLFSVCNDYLRSKQKLELSIGQSISDFQAFSIEVSLGKHVCSNTTPQKFSQIASELGSLSNLFSTALKTEKEVCALLRIPEGSSYFESLFMHFEHEERQLVMVKGQLVLDAFEMGHYEEASKQLLCLFNIDNFADVDRERVFEVSWPIVCKLYYAKQEASDVSNKMKNYTDFNRELFALLVRILSGASRRLNEESFKYIKNALTLIELIAFYSVCTSRSLVSRSQQPNEVPADLQLYPNKFPRSQQYIFSFEDGFESCRTDLERQAALIKAIGEQLKIVKQHIQNFDRSNLVKSISTLTLSLNQFKASISEEKFGSYSVNQSIVGEISSCCDLIEKIHSKLLELAGLVQPNDCLSADLQTMCTQISNKIINGFEERNTAELFFMRVSQQARDIVGVLDGIHRDIKIVAIAFKGEVTIEGLLDQKQVIQGILEYHAFSIVMQLKSELQQNIVKNFERLVLSCDDVNKITILHQSIDSLDLGQHEVIQTWHTRVEETRRALRVTRPVMELLPERSDIYPYGRGDREKHSNESLKKATGSFYDERIRVLQAQLDERIPLLVSLLRDVPIAIVLANSKECFDEYAFHVGRFVRDYVLLAYRIFQLNLLKYFSRQENVRGQGFHDAICSQLSGWNLWHIFHEDPSAPLVRFANGNVQAKFTDHARVVISQLERQLQVFVGYSRVENLADLFTAFNEIFTIVRRPLPGDVQSQTYKEIAPTFFANMGKLVGLPSLETAERVNIYTMLLGLLDLQEKFIRGNVVNSDTVDTLRDALAREQRKCVELSLCDATVAEPILAQYAELAVLDTAIKQANLAIHYDFDMGTASLKDDVFAGLLAADQTSAQYTQAVRHIQGAYADMTPDRVTEFVTRFREYHARLKRSQELSREIQDNLSLSTVNEDQSKKVSSTHHELFDKRLEKIIDLIEQMRLSEENLREDFAIPVEISLDDARFEVITVIIGPLRASADQAVQVVKAISPRINQEYEQFVERLRAYCDLRQQLDSLSSGLPKEMLQWLHMNPDFPSVSDLVLALKNVQDLQQNCGGDAYRALNLATYLRHRMSALLRTPDQLWSVCQKLSGLVGLVNDGEVTYKREDDQFSVTMPLAFYQQYIQGGAAAAARVQFGDHGSMPDSIGAAIRKLVIGHSVTVARVDGFIHVCKTSQIRFSVAERLVNEHLRQQANLDEFERSLACVGTFTVPLLDAEQTAYGQFQQRYKAIMRSMTEMLEYFSEFPTQPVHLGAAAPKWDVKFTGIVAAVAELREFETADLPDNLKNLARYDFSLLNQLLVKIHETARICQFWQAHASPDFMTNVVAQVSFYHQTLYKRYQFWQGQPDRANTAKPELGLTPIQRAQMIAEHIYQRRQEDFLSKHTQDDYYSAVNERIKLYPAVCSMLSKGNAEVISEFSQFTIDQDVNYCIFMAQKICTDLKIESRELGILQLVRFIEPAIKALVQFTKANKQLFVDAEKKYLFICQYVLEKIKLSIGFSQDKFTQLFKQTLTSINDLATEERVAKRMEDLAAAANLSPHEQIPSERREEFQISARQGLINAEVTRLTLEIVELLQPKIQEQIQLLAVNKWMAQHREQYSPRAANMLTILGFFMESKGIRSDFSACMDQAVVSVGLMTGDVKELAVFALVQAWIMSYSHEQSSREYFAALFHDFWQEHQDLLTASEMDPVSLIQELLKVFLDDRKGQQQFFKQAFAQIRIRTDELPNLKKQIKQQWVRAIKQQSLVFFLQDIKEYLSLNLSSRMDKIDVAQAMIRKLDVAGQLNADDCRRLWLLRTSPAVTDEQFHTLIVYLSSYKKQVLENKSYALANFSHADLQILKGIDILVWHGIVSPDDALHAKVQSINTEEECTKKTFNNAEVQFLRELLMRHDDSSFALAEFTLVDIQALKRINKERWCGGIIVDSKGSKGDGEKLHRKIQAINQVNEEYKQVSFSGKEINDLKIILNRDAKWSALVTKLVGVLSTKLVRDRAQLQHDFSQEALVAIQTFITSFGTELDDWTLLKRRLFVLRKMQVGGDATWRDLVEDFERDFNAANQVLEPLFLSFTLAEIQELWQGFVLLPGNTVLLFSELEHENILTNYLINNIRDPAALKEHFIRSVRGLMQSTAAPDYLDSHWAELCFTTASDQYRATAPYSQESIGRRVPQFARGDDCLRHIQSTQATWARSVGMLAGQNLVVVGLRDAAIALLKYPRDVLEHKIRESQEALRQLTVKVESEAASVAEQNRELVQYQQVMQLDSLKKALGVVIAPMSSANAALHVHVFRF